MVASSELKLRSTYFTTSAVSHAIGSLSRTVFFALCWPLRVGFDIRHTRICHKFYCGMGRDHARISGSAQSPGYDHQRTASVFFLRFAQASRLPFNFFRSTTSLGYMFSSFLHQGFLLFSFYLRFLASLNSDLFLFYGLPASLSRYGQCFHTCPALVVAVWSAVHFSAPRMTCCAGS